MKNEINSAFGCDMYNGMVTGDVTCALTAEGHRVAGHSGSSVIILNPHDSQGVQIADGTGIYPCLRGCGGAGYQQGYVLQHLKNKDEKHDDEKNI